MPDATTTDEHATRSHIPDNRAHLAVEAILLAIDKPLPPRRIAAAIGLEDNDNADQRVLELVQILNDHYHQTDRAFRIEKVAGGLRVMTTAEFAAPVAAAHGMHASARLSRAAVETLAIIAYRQPITRADIEAIRGVACGEVLKGLLEKKLIAITGRAEELGRPILYGTTKRFLEVFGLASLKDLPEIDRDTPDAIPGLPTKTINNDEHNHQHSAVQTNEHNNANDEPPNGQQTTEPPDTSQEQEKEA